MASPSRAERSIPSGRAIQAVAALGLLAALVPLSSEWLGALPGALLLGGALTFAVLLIEDWLLRPRRGEIAIARDELTLQHIGRKGQYRLRIENHSRRVLRVDYALGLPAGLDGEPLHGSTRLAPGASHEATHEFVAVERGEHELPPVGLRTETVIGLWSFQRHHQLGESIRVAPGRPASETTILLRRAALLIERGERLARQRGQDQDFDSLREYVVGDEPRRVDWKASSRRHRPMVQVHRSERNTQMILALDLGRLMGGLVHGLRKLDLAMTPLLDLAAVSLQRGERVGLLAFDSQPRIWLPPRPGLAQLRHMIEALASAEVRDAPTSYLRGVSKLRSAQRKRSLIALFSDFTDEITAREATAGLAHLARHHEVLFLAVSDPHLEDIVAAPRNAGADIGGPALFQASVAAQLLAERRRTLHTLQRLGVNTLELDPRQATGAVLEKYLEMRLHTVLR
jgi:uncharacterized protein (DUF58 family)